MKSAVYRHGGLQVVDVDEPTPAAGQVLVRPLACGICGSDLHFVRHAAQVVSLQDDLAGQGSIPVPPLDLEQDVFLGHEFVAEVLEAGPDTEAPAPGSVVTSVPLLLGPPQGLHFLAYTNGAPAGFSERMLLSAPLLLEVPNGLAVETAALTEPLAVGVHAVARAEVGPGDRALVVGAGPVGLTVLAALAVAGVEQVVVSDPVASRRQVAASLGASAVVDPTAEDPFEALGGGPPPVVFEAVGVPGILGGLLRRCPARSRVVVVGVCMEPDTYDPFFAVAKEIDLRYCFAYDPEEFARSLRLLAEGTVRLEPMITGTVGLTEVQAAFSALAAPEGQTKILVRPNGD
jgi:2-desacetyl-2-hydroxyethyl bacteriochlorophyllide A dehydrogenase